uniref:Uncharacterized protein n=1 Tax=Tanacetum cinerariifolium TaxID=118510 RepID=A0A6L2LIR0_TANCI|nr:hypothetical protein [Tanacetum cinerariifolium]
MSLDDLYNHLKVYKSEVQKKSELNSQNMAFISSAKHNSRNEDGNTACVPTAITNVPTASASVATISQDTAYAYIASQSSGSQIKFEDIIQIDEDDMEEIDIKWNMALLSMRADKFWKKTRKKISIQGSDVAGFDKSKVECFNSEEQAPKALMAIDRVGWDWSYMANDEEDHALVADEVALTEFALMANTNAERLAQVESRLVEYKEREVKYCEKIRTLEFRTESNNECIEILKKKLETLKLVKDGVDGKLAGLLIASKDLDNLIESQRADKNKEGLGYSAVPPPPVQIYSSSKKDLSWTGLPNFADDTVTDYSRPSPTMESTSGNDQDRNPSVSETVVSPITPKPFIKFVKPKDSQSKSKTCKTETPKKPPVKYAEQYRKPNKKPNKKSFTPKPVDHRPYRPPVRLVRTNMNGARSNKTSFNKQAHSYTNKPFHRTSAGRPHYRAPWVPTVNRNFPPVNRKFSTGSRNFPTANRKFPTASRKFPAGSTKCSTANMGMKGKAVKPSACWFWKPSQNLYNKGQFQNNIDDKGYWDSGFSRHMKGNISCLFDYEPFNGGYVSFECIVLGKDFKLLDDANILLRTPRQHNMYSIDLNNIVPHRDLTCLVAKASADECMLWHRRLGHLNFKTMNKLVRRNLVRGLSTKCFENDNTCTACLKGKQHKASCKSKLVNSVSKPLHTFHMDLFGPTSNGVAERRNKTLIEAARTMLADAKLLVTFWAEVVNIACYVQNRVLVNKSQNKTPYELFNGRSPAIGFLKPFDCHVMILNTLDNLGKFEKKGDEGYFIGYSIKPQDHCSTKVPEGSGNPNPTASRSNPPADPMETLTVKTPIPTANSPVLTAYSTDSQEPLSDARLISKRVANQEETPSLDNILSLTNRFEDILGVTTNSDESNGVEADISNMEIAIIASPTPTLRIHKDYPKRIDYDEVFAPVARIEAIRLFLAYASFMGFTDPEFPIKVYKVEKAMYGLHQAPRAWGTIDQTHFIRRQGGDFILVQVYVDDIIFGSSNPQLCREFKALMHEKFQMSAMGDILKKFRYSDVRSSNTPMDKENPWGKDGTGKDVDLHLYRSMIGSLMYLTASRPDIMFAVCACARHQVTPKECHMHAVKRIFRYLKGHPKLGLWYPKESPFDLVAYSDSDYSGATQDHKSTTGGCQFLGRRLISWQYKKQTIVATSTTEAEYVVAASCCGQVPWIQN